MTYHKMPDAACPVFLPVDSKPWRLAGPRGHHLRDEIGKSYKFDTPEEALEWLKDHDMKVLHPWQRD